MTGPRRGTSELRQAYCDERQPGVRYASADALAALQATKREREAVRAAAVALHEFEAIQATQIVNGHEVGGAGPTQNESADVVMDRLCGDLPLRRRTLLLRAAVDLAQEQGAAKSFVKASAWRKNLTRQTGGGA